MKKATEEEFKVFINHLDRLRRIGEFHQDTGARRVALGYKIDSIEFMEVGKTLLIRAAEIAEEAIEFANNGIEAFESLGEAYIIMKKQYKEAAEVLPLLHEAINKAIEQIEDYAESN